MKWVVWVATCGGLGYFPVFPGTIGSILGLLIFFLLPPLSPLVYSFILVILFLLGVYTSTRSEPYFKKKDASHIIIDELHAMLLVPFLLPPTYAWGIAGLIVFRFFDIRKPPPIRKFEKLPGGWGVMVDDSIAAFYTVAVLRIAEMLIA